MTIRLADAEPSPDVFAAVMATGVLSIGVRDHGYRWISDTLGVVATCGLVFLVALVTLTAGPAFSGRRNVRWDLTDPDVTLRLFTFVAACDVIDSRLSSKCVGAVRARRGGAVILAGADRAERAEHVGALRGGAA